MPIRERIKKAFGRSSTGTSETSSLSKRSSRRNSNVYQPGEKMPPMKYRRPVAKEHKEKLEAFTFAKAWRRKSEQSMYSPMGSRMPSRRNSSKTFGRKSFQSTVRAGSSVGKVPEVDDSDVMNVGLSRQHTADGDAKRRNRAGDSIDPVSRVTNAQPSPNGSPFTAEDLTLAMKRSHLDVPS
ncbi:hypothetical protein M501DRAFT_1006150 [Patellaria atrata CBS 101060]|uniref:Uncharacterized protein n=1 Tax=Patellaria atrata CBS 101060 TaxID=1346257 RepID=A0A9P4VVJ8_9PEZI|nr:hypothetical protein M501DRAFT_1006150 [Patellaria atrata CBS 101060]